MTSRYSPYSNLVFRQVFNSESDVIANGGTSTNVVFEKGYAKFNGTSSGIVYPINFNGTYSFRVKFKTATSFASSQYLFDLRKGTGTGYAYVTDVDIVSTGTEYSNGVASTSSVNVKEIILSGMAVTSKELTLGRRTAPFTSHLLANIELFEIYQGTLTAQEVKNLYENKWNTGFVSKDKLCDINAFNGVLKDRTDLTLTPSNVDIKKTNNYYSPSFNGVDSTLITDSTDPEIWQQGFTLIAWVYNNYIVIGRIFDKSTGAAADDGFYLSTIHSDKYVTNINAISAVYSANDSFKLNKWQFVVLTVGANSKINFYIGDLQTAPTLSGKVNQSVSPVSDITTTNPLTIGNRSTATDRGFAGLIPFAQAYSGVLSVEDICQIWSNSRGFIR
jgi:hypothetical protein